MYLLDTNILSELIKKRPSPNLIRHLQLKAPQDFFTSSICVLELRFGSALRPDFESFWTKIEEQVLSRVTVIPFGYKEALIAGDILSGLKKKGQLIGLEDILIGATALANRLVVVTGNIRHFRRIQGLKVENWLGN